MRVRGSVDLGVATHTGMQRHANEDDYLVLSGVDNAHGADLFAIADGMGGMAGGAEASRTALRGLALGFSAGQGGDLLERLRRGHAEATVRVAEAARQLPALRDMGTTLTALATCDGRAAFAHIGDCRLLRLRGRQLVQFTTDHARADLDHVLTRCIGAGQQDQLPDAAWVDLEPGDTVALLSDGVWKPVGEEHVARLLHDGPAQQVAERLVGAALAAGGPDNATAIVLRLRGGDDQPVAVELPREERVLLPVGHGASLRSPRWPLVLLAAAVAVLVLAALRTLGWFDAASLFGR